MKVTQVIHHQFGGEFEPDEGIAIPNSIPPSNFPSPSGKYFSPLTIDTTAKVGIFVPFKVKKIHVKGISYVVGMNSLQATAGIIEPDVKGYVVLMSNLIGNSAPLGMVYLDSAYSSSTIQDIEHTFLVPQTIQGVYDITLYNATGDVFAGYQQTIDLAPLSYNYFLDSFSLTLEFLSEEDE